MSSAYIIGVGITPFGKFPDASVKTMAAQAIGDALADAGLQAGDVQAAYFANVALPAIEGQYTVSGQVVLRPLGIEGVPVTNVENGCASASTALNAACGLIKSGQAEIVLAIGAERMNCVDRERSFAVFNGAWDRESVEGAVARLQALSSALQMPPDALGQGDERHSVFMDVYSALARLHMITFGTTQADMAAVSAKNHTHAHFNPKAHYRQPMTVAEVLQGRQISWPLTLPMCAPVSDGAAAAIVCSEAVANRLGQRRAIRVGASVLRSGSTRQPNQFDKHVCHLAANAAYEMAGIGPHDVSVAEVHDASAFAEIQEVEALGFCAFGDGGRLTRDGHTRLGGRIPVNPSGGLESRGHPLGATGLAQIHELVTQLRHEAGNRQVHGARIAIAQNSGGFLGCEEAAACITILQR